MINNRATIKLSTLFIKKAGFIIGILLFPNLIFAQENPPTPISVEVSAVQFLNFGTFTTSNTGGTISVNYLGQRTQTGDVVLLNYGATPSYASYDVTASPGTILTITHPNNIPLSGSNTGTIYLNIDSYSNGKTFLAKATPPMTNAISIGGTLSIGDLLSNPPGNYSGTVTITLIQQ